MRSMTDENAFSSVSTGVMSLKTMPFWGKSGMSRTSALTCSIVWFTEATSVRPAERYPVRAPYRRRGFDFPRDLLFFFLVAVLVPPPRGRDPVSWAVVRDPG